MHDPIRDSEEEGTSATTVLAMAVGAALFVALGYWFTTLVEPVDATSFAFGPLEIDAKRLSEERANKFGSELDLSDKRATRLIEVVKQANEDQFGSPSDETKRRRSQEIQIAADESLELDGESGFHAIGTTLFDECEEALKTYISEKPDRDTVLQSEKFEPYRRACGDLVPHLKRLKLLTENADWVDPSTGRELVRIMNRYRWAFILAKRTSRHDQLTPYEYELLERWRTTSDAFGTEERVKFAKRAADRIEGFPTDEIVAKIFVQGGDFDKAHPFMARWCRNDKSPQTGAMCRWFEQKRTSSAPPNSPTAP